MAISTPDARYVEVNTPFAAYFGYTPDQMVGRSVAELGILANPHDGQEIERILGESASFRDRELELRTRAGAPRVALLSIESIALGGQTLRLSILTDVTARRQAETRVRALNRELSLLSEANQILMREREPTQLYAQICRAAVEKGGFGLAWIGLVDARTGALRQVARAGASVQWRAEPRTAPAACAPETVARERRRTVLDLAPPTAASPPCHTEVWNAGFRAVAAFPLFASGRIRGVLSLYSEIQGFFEADELRLLDELAADLSFAMELNEREADRARAVNALRESEMRYRDLVRMSPVAILVQRQGEIVFANPAALDLFGASAESQLLGKTPFQIMQSDSHREIEESIAALNRGEILPPVRQKALRLDGTTLEVDVSAAPFDDRGTPAIQVVLRDVSERERAGAALAESENRLRKAQDMAHVGNWEIDLATRTIWGSEEALRIYGLAIAPSRRDLSVVQTCVHPADRQRLDVALKALIAEGRPYDEEFRIHKAADGAPRVLHSRAERLRDGGGNVTAIVGVVQDVTERVRVEEALRESEERIKTTLYSIGDGVITTDLQGAVAQMNRVAEQLTGWTEMDARGRPVTEVLSLVDEESGALRPSPIPHVLAEMRTTSVGPGVALLSRDGKRRPVSCTAAAIRAGQGSPSGAVLVFEDETRERDLEAQVRQAQKLEAVGRLAGGIAHDYNNMVSVILGYTEVVKDGLSAMDPLRQSVQAIADAARRSAGLTRQLLAFARRQIVAPVSLDLNAAIGSMEKMLQRLVGEDIELVLRADPGLWLARIDPTQVDQILANLATNARDAIQDTGTIIIETTNVTVDESYARDHVDAATGDFVMIAFSDTGTGMDKATLARLFEPFFTTKPVGQGTGLGMATVFGIVKQNNGFINVYSEPGKGTTVKVFLPRAHAPEEAPAAESREPPARGSETLLLVEDEPALLGLARMTLERSGYRVLAAASPAEALRACESHAGAIALLITDVVMPGMNGRELHQRLIAMRPGLRALYMSGYTADIIAHRGIVDEGVAFLPKPFTPQDLVRRVREALDSAP
jgi:two-component system, cell cycle sensor histidine kinase and response regulator CckA